MSALTSPVAARVLGWDCFGAGRNAEIHPQMRAVPYPQALRSHKLIAGSELLLGKGDSFCRLVPETCKPPPQAGLGSPWQVQECPCVELSAAQQTQPLLPCPSPRTQPFPPQCEPFPVSVLGRLADLLGRDKSTLWAAASVLFLLPAVFLTSVQPEQSPGA